jgi:beta-galactosidase
LNELWSTYYQRWDEIEPLRTGIFERAQAAWVDWREFMLWNLADFQHFKADAARRADPTRPITCHIGGVGSDYVYHCADEYQVTEFMDVVGLSFFPYWMMYGSGSYELSWGALALDGVRSFGRGKPMWVEELQGGPSVYGMHYHSPEPQPEDIRLWVWQVIAHGGKGIHFWNWRPELTGIEASGFGMVAADGSPTPRAQAAGDLGKLLQRHAKRIMSAQAWPAEIAILHSPRTAILAFGEEEAGWPFQSERGVYRALWRHQMPVDFIVTRQLAESVDLSRYRIIYVPLAYTLSRAEGDQLRKFVASGGTLVGDLWCGLKDEHTFIYEQMPGAGLAEVFGCEMRELVPSNSSSVNLLNPETFGSSLAAGTRFEVKRYRAKMKPKQGCRIVGVFEDGSPAVLVNDYQKGKAVYVPALLGLAFDEKPDENLARFLADLALWSGVRSPIQLESTPAQALSECRLLRGEKDDMLVLLNHSEQPVSCQIRLLLARHRGATLSDLLSGDTVPARQDSRSMVVDVKLDPTAVKVWLMSLRASSG